MTFKKGVYPKKEYNEKLEKFKDYVAKQLNLDRDNLIVDTFASLMRSSDVKDKAKAVEILFRNMDMDAKEPGAISPDVLAILGEFDRTRRKKVKKEGK